MSTVHSLSPYIYTHTYINIHSYFFVLHAVLLTEDIEYYPVLWFLFVCSCATGAHNTVKHASHSTSLLFSFLPCSAQKVQNWWMGWYLFTGLNYQIQLWCEINYELVSFDSSYKHSVARWPSLLITERTVLQVYGQYSVHADASLPVYQLQRGGVCVWCGVDWSVPELKP